MRLQKLFLTVLVVLPATVLSQQFYFKCFFHKIAPPDMYFVPGDNLFDNTNSNRIALIKASDTSAYIYPFSKSAQSLCL